jgi:hypothetical protein
MRTIFYGKKHKIITATRAPLRELIWSQDAITSPFWNIFDMNPVRVDAFDDQDRGEILEGLSEHTFLPGAKTELNNWSAGFPLPFLGILNQIFVDIPSGQVDNQIVNRTAARAAETLSGGISLMWEDCPAPAKVPYIHLVDHGDLLHTEVGKDEQRCLIEKCFARQSETNLLPLAVCSSSISRAPSQMQAAWQGFSGPGKTTNLIFEVCWSAGWRRSHSSTSVFTDW